MTRHSVGNRSHHSWQGASLWACILSFVAGCASRSPAPPPPAAPPAPVLPSIVPPPAPPPQNISRASNAQDYRPDAARHLYKNNGDRIYVGKLPPLLYAVGVLETDIDAQGFVTGVRWMRAPTHAPEVMAEIERTIRQASPFPVPAKLGKITYTDTWLWHKSGQFQLHTLSEGQL
ncbi:MAG: hypothetical protein Q8R67_07145 [Rhodoferax sp.]|nr:hypothetical protein [Rhodoferax sp.]MDP3651440.1 hypothetical protein [Rhodoferax sp.]